MVALSLALKAPEIIAVCSFSVALAALGVAIWQGYLQRRHYELSAQPCIEIYFGASSKIGIGLWLKNDGLGPGRVKSIEATSPESAFNLMDRQELELFVRTIAPEVPGPKMYAIARLDPGSTIGIGDHVDVISTDQSMNLHAVAGAAVLSDYRVRVVYESLYAREYVSELKGGKASPPSWHEPTRAHT